MKKLLKNIITGKYDPVAYWNKRPNPNNAQGESSERVAFDVDYIARAVNGETRILELGPGVGRTFEAYSKDCQVTTLDISTQYSSKLAAVGKAIGVSINQLRLESITEPFPLDDNAFPVGIASQVLLHIEPEPLLHSIKELIRVCEKVVVITAYTHGKPLRAGPSHVFNHDYFTLFTKLECAMHDVIMNEGRICFTVRKRMC